MSLIQKYVEKTQAKQVNGINTWADKFDAGVDIVEKQFVQLGSVQSYSTKDITVQQRLRAQQLKMLFSMSPSANQAWEKVVSCVMSDGYRIRHKDKTKVEDMDTIKKIHTELDDLKLHDTIQHMLWANGMFGDSLVYCANGKGTKKTRDLVPLNNEYLYFDIDKDLYRQTGVVKITKFRYQIPPIPGTVNGAQTVDIVEYEPDEVMRWSRKTPFNDVTGTAYLEEDQATLILGLKVLNHNLRFFQNSAKPPVIVNLGPGTTYERALEYKKVLDSKYRGSNNMWETMVTWGDTKVQELTLPDSTQFFDMLTYVRVQVCGLLNVPPSEIGVVDKNGLNSSETAHKDFIKTNINAKKRALGRFLTKELLNKRLGYEDYELYFPLMDAINEKQRAETNSNMLQTGQITLDEARELLGRDTINEEWSKTLYFGNMNGIKGLVPYADAEESSLMAAPTGGKVDGPGPDKKDGGRPDLDGRNSEPHDGINDDDAA